jgi:radical SAM superfamily enzyme with C-terminal helix-hairpin-helix motif
MAAHLPESKKILNTILNTCTSGNILSFGLESADNKVIKMNNLNSNPQEVHDMIKLVNKYGSSRGSTGMPELLPGLNFVYGLKGETKETLIANLDFLKSILDEGLILRRINLRQVLTEKGIQDKRFRTRKYHRDFIKHKNSVREQIDRPMLKRLFPVGTTIKKVFMEITKGNTTFGRQIGTYPILVGIPYKIPEKKFYNVAITDYGYRSITGFTTPFKINFATERMLQALPGIGSKRARRLASSKPYRSFSDVNQVLDDQKLIQHFEGHLSFEYP